MKAVIYARYSSDNQREESIEGQLRECKEYAEYNDITVVGTYIDRAMSAKTDNRPNFQKMIKDSAKHIFDVVIVWKLDRFARNRYDSAYYKNSLKKNGVRVISAKESISEGAEEVLEVPFLDTATVTVKTVITVNGAESNTYADYTVAEDGTKTVEMIVFQGSAYFAEKTEDQDGVLHVTTQSGRHFTVNVTNHNIACRGISVTSHLRGGWHGVLA